MNFTSNNKVKRATRALTIPAVIPNAGLIAMSNPGVINRSVQQGTFNNMSQAMTLIAQGKGGCNSCGGSN